MGHCLPFPKGVLVVSAIYNHHTAVTECIQTMVDQWGPIGNTSPLFLFDHSTHYEPEMGSPLVRQIFSFKTPISLSDCALHKKLTQDWEATFSINKKRQFNLDPGYLTPYQVVLSTTKNFAHRIPLQDGIYAELTYIRKSGTYEPLPWTYPDLKQEKIIHFFESVRLQHITV